MRNCNSCPVFRFPNKARLFNDRGRLLQNNLGLLKNRGFIETPYRDLRYAVLWSLKRRFVLTAPHPSLKVVKLLIFLFPLGITIVTLKCCM